jgi:ribosomal silencing factor RsfS
VEVEADDQKAESINKPIATEDQSWLLYDLGDVVVHLMN